MANAAVRMSQRLPLIVGGVGFGLCAFAFLVSGLYLDWNSTKLINFLAAWIPFALSVLFAFVPSGKEMKHQLTKWGWRGAVVIVGFLWSAMLWHQQDLSDQVNSKQTKEAIGAAVSQANQHADSQFAKVKENLGGVQSQVTGLGQSLSSALEKSTSELNNNLGKVGKPDPPALAKLSFSLWKNGMSTTEWPITSEVIEQEPDGSFEFSFAVKNDSPVEAEKIDVWITLCDLCEYASEPHGLNKPGGALETMRHGASQSLNPGVASEPTAIKFKLKNDVDLSKFSNPKVGVTFSGSCKGCGPQAPSTLLDLYLRPKPSATSP